VLERQIQEHDPFISQTIEKINKQHRILALCRKDERFSKRFYHWQPERKIEKGDQLLFLNQSVSRG
jgi:hypothetical protein